MSPKKQVWLVTGTSSGLGYALLHELLKTGQSVVATSRNPVALQAKLDERYDVETLKRALVVGLDITKVDEVKAVFAKAIDKFGRIDVVVNNAGYAVIGEVEVSPVEVAREQFEVMLWGPVYICKEAIRIFREVNRDPTGEGGHIFNVSSVAGYFAQPSMSYYVAAKFALEGFTESLRKEMNQEWNIQVTIIEPGGFNTEWRNMTSLPLHPAYDTDNSPTKMQRSALIGTESRSRVPFIGSSEKAAKAFITLAEMRQELPLRVQFGSDSSTIVQYTATKTISDSQKFEYISHSTNVDGIDSKEYSKNLLAALGKGAPGSKFRTCTWWVGSLPALLNFLGGLYKRRSLKSF